MPILRRKPAQVDRRSKGALEAMCLAIVKRLPGLERTRHVEVIEIEFDDEGTNWRMGSISPPLSLNDWKRAEGAIDPWRLRFQLAQ